MNFGLSRWGEGHKLRRSRVESWERFLGLQVGGRGRGRKIRLNGTASSRASWFALLIKRCWSDDVKEGVFFFFWQRPPLCAVTELCYIMYSVIKKDGLSFLSLYFKIITSDKYDVHYIWLYSWSRYSESSARSTGWLAWAALRTLLNSSHVLLWYTWAAGAFAFTQTAYLLNLVTPTTNAFPR